MVCNDCERCKTLGYKFCIRCGANFAMEAPIADYRVKPPEGRHPILEKTPFPGAWLFLILAIASIGLMLYYFGTTMEYAGTRQDVLYLFFWEMVKFMTLEPLQVQILFAFIGVCSIASLIMVIIDSKEFFKGGDKYVERASKTPLYWIGVLFGSTLVLESAMIVLLQLAGADVKVPDPLANLDFTEALYEYSFAGVWEEIVFRMVLMGIPMMIIAIAGRQKDFWKYPFGGFGVSRAAVILMIVSSIIFAYAHASGWGWWKSFTVLLGGLMFGYLFMRFGIHVTILVHLINDFFAVWLIAVDFWFTLPFLLILIFGVLTLPVMFVKTWYGIKHLKTMSNTGFKKDEPPEDPPQDNMGSNMY